MSKWLSIFLVCFATVGRAAVVFPPATQAEVDTGTVKTKFVSPFTLRNTTGLSASPGFMAQNTNIASRPSVSFWPGANITIITTNNANSNRVDYLISATGGSSGLTTNANQFGASTTLTIKDTALFTNATIRAIREPNLIVSRVVFNDANGMFTNVTSAAAGTDFVHADGSVGTSTTVLTTNGNQFGASVTLTVKNGPSFTNVISDANTPIVSQATNFIFDGGKGDYYVWGVSNLASTTPFNFIITNLQQKMRIDTWITNGQSVIIQVADGGNGTTVPATWYKDQTVINVDTNGHSSIHLWRNALGTNVAVETRTYGLAAGNNLAIVTNAVAGTLTMHIPASPTFTNTITFVGTVSTQEPQIKLKNTSVNGYLAFSNPTGWVPTNNVSLLITNALAGDILVVGSAAVSGGVAQLNITNAPASIITGSGSTQMVAAAAGNLTMTNQITYIPQVFNGSNGATATALTNNWDMALNTYKQVTNAVGTNLTFTLSNVTLSASLITKFKGLPGTTNKVFLQAVGGVNIKWLGYNTNTYGGAVGILGGYTYALQCFADEATNVCAWVTTDDPYIGPIVAIATNDLVINTRYTNTASTVSYVQCSMTLNASVTDIAQAVLLIDQNGDGTWDAWITNKIGSGVAQADSILMGGWVTNSGIFLITNQSTGSATATINPNSSQRISGFGTGPQGLTGPSGVQVFNSLPQSQTNYLPTYDRKMAWGKYDPNNSTTPVGQGDLGAPTINGTLLNDQQPSETNSHYGIIKATGGTIQASINPAVSQGLFIPTNRVFLYTATVGFSNAPGTNQMHMAIVNAGAFTFGDTVSRLGWVAITAGSAQTNWVAQYRSNNTTQITVYTSTAMTDQWHTLGIGNTNGNAIVWYLDGLPVATLTTPGLASPGGVGAMPVLGERVILSPNGTNFMFWQDFECVHEKTIPVSTGPL